MQNEMTPSQQDQRVVVDQILSTMANIHLLPEQDIKAGPFFNQQPLASMIGYTACANRICILHYSEILALQLTTSFFESSLPSSVDDADVTDRMTELTNMIGGNHKRLCRTRPHSVFRECFQGTSLTRRWTGNSAGPGSLCRLNPCALRLRKMPQPERYVRR